MEDLADLIDEYLIVGKKGAWKEISSDEVLTTLEEGIIIPRSIDFSYERAKQYFDRAEVADNFFDQLVKEVLEDDGNL